MAGKSRARAQSTASRPRTPWLHLDGLVPIGNRLVKSLQLEETVRAVAQDQRPRRARHRVLGCGMVARARVRVRVQTAGQCAVAWSERGSSRRQAAFATTGAGIAREGQGLSPQLKIHRPLSACRIRQTGAASPSASAASYAPMPSA